MRNLRERKDWKDGHGFALGSWALVGMAVGTGRHEAGSDFG